MATITGINSCNIIGICIFMSVVYVQCVPFDLSLDFGHLSNSGDSQIVQSLIREVRATPEHVQELVGPDTENAFLHKYSDGDDGDNEQGYHKRSQDKDAKGYKHFDSYHKKDGDKYGFQHQTAYGQENKDDGSASEVSGKYAEEDDGSQGQNEKLKQQEAEEAEEEEEGEGEETKNTYKVIEDVGEDYDGGAGSGGNYDEASDTGHYEEASEGGDEDGEEGGQYTEGEEAESEGYTEGGDDEEGDAESENYEAADEDYDEE